MKRGNLKEFIIWLIEENLDKEKIESFFYAYPHFEITPFDIWNIITARFQNPDIKIKSLILEFIRIWIQCTFKRDFLNYDGKLHKELLKFLENLQIGTENITKKSKNTYDDSKKKSNEFKLLILRVTRKKNLLPTQLELNFDLTMINTNVDISSPRKNINNLQQSPLIKLITKNSSSNTSNLQLNTNISNQQINEQVNNIPEQLGTITDPQIEKQFVLADLEPIDIAQQLTLIEYNLFKKIRDDEFHYINWKKTDSIKLSPHIVEMVARFNKVCYWVASEIVIQQELKKRVNVLKKFIMIAECLKEIGNFNGLMEILGGLNMLCVVRLTQTWAELPARFVNVFEELNNLMDTKQNYKNYREILQQYKLPILPYLGIFLRDFIFIDDGNPNYLTDDKNLINLDKIYLMGDLLISLKKYQKYEFNFPKNNDIIKYLKRLNYFPENLLEQFSNRCQQSKDLNINQTN